MDNLPPFPPFFGSSSNQNDTANDNSVENNDPMLIFNQDPNSGLPELPPVDPSLLNVVVPPQLQVYDFNNIANIFNYNQYDPSTDPYFWGGTNQPVGNVGASSSTGCTQENLLINSSHGSENLGVENLNQLPIWPVPPSLDKCSCCNVLREINHFKDNHVKNLELHGQIGVISHAILDKFYYEDTSPENHEPQMFDFCNVSIGVVHNFLVYYFEDCRREGYELLPDTLSSFYQTISVGLNGNGIFEYESSLQSSPIASGDLQTNQQDSESDEVRLSYKNKGKEIASQSKADGKGVGQGGKSNLAAQRERTGKLSLEDFSEYFHLPINQVAKIMKVCPTVIKKKCRLGGLARWPYRKVKGLKRQILIKQEELGKSTFEEKASLLTEIQVLEQELRSILRKLND